MQRKILFLALLLIACCNKVMALESFRKGDEIRGAYVRVQDKGEQKDLKISFYYDKNDEVVYLLQPGEDIELDKYSESTISEDTFKELINLMYYGYGYKKNVAQKWYVVTQVMIWQEIYGEENVSFLDSQGGKVVTKYEEEIESLKQLVERHKLEPNFAKKQVNYLQQEVLVDSNEVLSEFTTSVGNIKDNNLELNVDDTNDYEITFKKTGSRFNHKAMVYQNNSTYILMPGDYETIAYTYNFEVTYGYLNVVPIIDDVYCAKCMDGVTYGIYLDDHYIKQFNINDTDKITLGVGKYTIKYLKRDLGFKKDENVYEIEITDKVDTNVDINVEKIKNTINIQKYNYKIEDNDSTFEVVDEQGNVVKNFKVSNGEFELILGYGNYVLKHISNDSRYSLVADTNLKVRTDGLVHNKILVSELVEPVKVPDTLSLSSLVNSFIFFCGGFCLKLSKKW